MTNLNIHRVAHIREMGESTYSQEKICVICQMKFRRLVKVTDRLEKDLRALEKYLEHSFSDNHCGDVCKRASKSLRGICD